MRKNTVLWLLCALSVALSGCGRRTEAQEDGPSPAPEQATAAPAAAEEPTPDPTAQPAPESSPTPAIPETPVWIKADRPRSYLLLAGPGGGAGAMKNWLMGDGGAKLSAYVPAGLEGPLFTLTFTPRDNAAEIPAATEETRYIRMAVDATVLNSGILEELLPAFESACGYTVEVYSGSTGEIQTWAGSAEADLVLIPESDAAGLSRRGFETVTAYASADYLLETP